MSLSRILSTARQSLLASQAATQATTNNVANSETPGYTRRTVGLQTAPLARSGVVFRSPPSPGGGVTVESFDRARSEILDAAVRRGRAGSSGAGEGAVLLGGLEGQLAAAGGDEMLGALGDFFAAWDDVAAAPTEGGPRDSLLAAARDLARTLASADDRVRAYGAGVQGELAATVERANALFAEVASLNETVRTARAQGADNADALDRRDGLLDEIAGLVPITVRPQASGAVTVTVGGMVAVQDKEARPLRLALPPAVPTPTVSAAGAPQPLRLDPTGGGAIGAQLHLLGTALPDARASLDALAAGLVAGVNAAHATGEGRDGVSGRPFFDPAGVTASSIALAVSDPDHVAAGVGGPGDSTVAASIAGLAESASRQAARTLAGVGTEVRRATAAAQASAAVTAHAEALRDGVSRVSLDEEMTNLVRYQQAYAASARVLQTADAMFDTLLAL